MSTPPCTVYFTRNPFHSIARPLIELFRRYTSRLPRRLWLVIAVFAGIYGCISLVNHALFKTAALDLGMMNHALHSFSNFESYTFHSLDSNPDIERNFFGAHFSPIMFLYVPFYYVFGSYTLLLLQILAVLLGGVGMYRWMENRSGNTPMSILTAVHFYSIWGIYSALAFDFHNNVMGAMLVPWLVLAYEQGKFRRVVLWTLLMLSCQEHLALWLVFIFAGLTALNWKERRRHWWNFELPMMAACGLYFGVVLGWAMPALAGESTSSQLNRYGAFGNGPLEIALNILTHPWSTLQHVFLSRDAPALYALVKTEFNIMVLLAGGWAAMYRPQFLIMLVPLYLQKMLTSNPDFWGISYQYSIEFVPVLSLATGYAVGKMRRPTIQRIAAGTACFLALSSTLVTMTTREARYERDKVDFLHSSHYRTDVEVKAVRTALASLPEGATLSVSSRLAPHLTARERLLLFPDTKDADFIVLLTGLQNTFPLSPEDHGERVRQYRQSPDVEVNYDDHGLLIVWLQRPRE